MIHNPVRPAGGHRFSLYRKLSLTFLLLLSVLAVAYSFLTVFSANRYFEATHQRLNQNVAAHIVEFASPFLNNEVDRKGAEAIFFNAMVTNPSVEVYLLDSVGRVLVYHAPASKIQQHHVALIPIRQFIQSQGQVFIKGDDPRDANDPKIFSAAEVRRRGQLQGYVYVILAGEDYSTVMNQLLSRYILPWGALMMLLTMAAAVLIGLIVIYLLTKNLNNIIQTVQQFRAGNLSARIQVKTSNELAVLADTFNDMADTLAQNITDLTTAERLRRDLVANVSHDLRTPIAAIRGYAETLTLTGSLEETEQKYAGIILQSAEKLTHLVNELVDLSKLEARETQPHQEPFTPGELVSEIYSTFRLIAKQRALQFTCVNCEANMLCYADSNLIERVLQNLVENAIRHAPVGGSVTIELRLANPTSLSIAVMNTIDHLPDDILNYLTNSYLTTNNASVRPAGIGLGLAIVARILYLHQTQLQVVQPTPDTLRLWFYLPLYTEQHRQ